MTGMRAPTFVLGTVGFTYLLSGAFFVPQLLVSLYVFHLNLSINAISFILAVVISSVIVFSLAMLAAGIKLVTKVTDPITWFIGVAQQLLAGMTFPIEHLNDYVPGLSTVSWILPQTWVYHIIRLSTLTDGSLTQVPIAISFGGASLFALILMPIGIHTFRWGLKRAKQEGSIGWT